MDSITYIKETDTGEKIITENKFPSFELNKIPIWAIIIIFILLVKK